MEVQLSPKQERQLRAARALAKVRSSKEPGKNFYINEIKDDYIVVDVKNSTSKYCYKNGNEIAV